MINRIIYRLRLSPTVAHRAKNQQYTAMRHYSRFENRVMQADTALRTLLGGSHTTGRPYPAENIDDSSFSDSEKQHIAGLMRVNHSGEVSAQALYQGQALTCRNAGVRDKLQQAAIEENDHLDWPKFRLLELGSHTSYLNPLWYGGSLLIGATAGVIGDKWNLGFLAETEHQVVRHLDSHLDRLPGGDLRSRAIIEQMKIDEGRHATTAIDSGAADLPEPVKQLMGLMSKVRTRTTYYL